VRGTEVTINVSLGAKPTTVPTLAGMTLDDATKALEDLNMKVGDEPVEQFDATIAKGSVISAAAADGTDLSAGGASSEGVTVNLVVSVGALPPIQGMTVDDARSALTDAGLKVQSGAQEDYNETVPEGQVIGILETGAVRPDDTVTIDVSRGPAPVPIPDVVGMVWSDAKKALTDLGFNVSYNHKNSADAIPKSFHVRAVEPGVGVEAPRGSDVKVTLDFTG
jgi:serine/threonine-protein kinase